jgi:HK97 family phage major capsid protein
MPTAAIMAPRSYTTLGGLLDTTNQPRNVPPVMASWQMIATSQIPINLTVRTSTDCSEIYVGAFSNLVFVLRERPSIMLAREVAALTGEVAFICHVRADVAVNYPAAFAVATGVRA